MTKDGRYAHHYDGLYNDRGKRKLSKLHKGIVSGDVNKAFEEVEGRMSRGLHQSLLDKGITHHILWAGCRAAQTSADARIGGSWHGAFTYYFCKEMRESKNKLFRAELLKKVRADLKTGRYTQTPQLECSAVAKKTPIA